MTIPLTGAGSLFVRLGHFFGGTLDINAMRGAAATARVLSGGNLATRTNATNIPDYSNGTAITQVINAIQATLASYQTTMQSFETSYKTYVQNTLQAMYGIDALAIPSNAPLSQFTAVPLLTAVQGLIAQMTTAGTSVQAATVSAGAQTAVGSPTGNPQIVVSLKNGKGLILQLPFPETLTFVCTKDANSGSATAGNETMNIAGQLAVADPLNYLYPGGSGISVNLQAVDGSKSYPTAGNLLVNSDFATCTTANYPDNWVAVVGTVGTQILNSGSAQAYTTGGGSVEMVGNGATLTAIKQVFSTAVSTVAGAGGSPYVMVPNAILNVNGYLKVSAVPAAGVLEIALVDSTNTIIQNDQGVNNSVTFALTGALTSYQAINGAFQLPSILPSQVGLRIRQSTAIDNGKNIFLGRFSLARADTNGNGLYAGGPMCTIHSGNTNLLDGVAPDTWTIAIANAYATSGSGLMQLMMDRFFGLRTLATPSLQLPYSGGPTVADSLIV